MTAFSEADLDRLADFVGGALDGTPEADDVRHLVSTDTTWAEAYSMLVTADAAVRDELHALGAEAPAVPLDVQQRLDAALASAIAAPPADAPVVDLARAREARKRRRVRWAAGLAAAAAVLVCGGLGVQIISNGSPRQEFPSAAQPNADARRSPESGSGQGQALDSGAAGSANAPVLSSGRDYAPGTLGDLTGGATAASGPKSSQNQNVQGEGQGRTSLPPSAAAGPLARLAQPAARAACLAAITGEYGGQVALVDYAAFEGQPALVVVVDGARIAAGKRLIIVVGPDCGIGGAIADERYRAIAP